MKNKSINENENMQTAPVKLPPIEVEYITGKEAVERLEEIEAELHKLPPPVNLSKMSPEEKKASIGKYVETPPSVKKRIKDGIPYFPDAQIIRNLEKLVAEYNGVPPEDICANNDMEEWGEPYVAAPCPPNVSGFFYDPQ